MSRTSALLKAIRIAIFVFTASLLFGCVTGEKMGRLSPGMSAADVVGVLGRPDGFRNEPDGSEVWTYSNRMASGWSNDRGDYNVVFQNGRVVQFGAGAIRQGPKPVVVIPLRGF
ncbi:MAG: outer membrane protein assembly factor BamE domain-containing protein [Chthoniobacterales bacterium]